MYIQKYSLLRHSDETKNSNNNNKEQQQQRRRTTTATTPTTTTPTTTTTRNNQELKTYLEPMSNREPKRIEELKRLMNLVWN